MLADNEQQDQRIEGRWLRMLVEGVVKRGELTEVHDEQVEIFEAPIL